MSLDEAQLHRFFDDLAVRFSTMDELDRQLARHFNAFRYISPNELRLSYIISDLLSPRGIHGQGDVFLRHFLNMIGLRKVMINGRVAVACEERATGCANPQRRIDIVLRPDGVFTIGIENKPWAGDQKGWVKDYSEHLAQQSGDRFRLVFLTRGERTPEHEEDRLKADGLEKTGLFIRINYELEFKNWLLACQRDAQPESVRRFLGDFIDFVQTMEATNVPNQQETDLIVSYLVEHPKSIHIAKNVEVAWPDLTKRIAVGFLKDLEERLRHLFGDAWRVKGIPPEKVLVKFQHFEVSKPEWGDLYHIDLAFDSNNCCDVCVGVGKSKSALGLADLRHKLKNLHSGWVNDDYWVWGWDCPVW